MNSNFIVLAALFGIMYVMLIRPQKKQLEARKKMMENLKVNDVLFTIGGIKGKVVAMYEETLRLAIAEKVEIEILKSAVSQVLTDDENEDTEAEEEYSEDDESSEEKENDRM